MVTCGFGYIGFVSDARLDLSKLCQHNFEHKSIMPVQLNNTIIIVNFE